MKPAPSLSGFSVRLSWTANRDRLVNTTGGGYRVYYATASGRALADMTMVDVPYVSGATAPTSVTIPNLNTYSPRVLYFRVVAYTALNPDGSQPSDEYPVRVER